MKWVITFLIALAALTTDAQQARRRAQAPLSSVGGDSPTAVGYDGTDDLTTGANVPFDSVQDDMTIALHVRASAPSSTLRGIWRHSDGASIAFGLYHDDDNTFMMYVGGGEVKTGPIVVGAWYHLAVTQDATTGAPQFWTNGVLVGTAGSRRALATATLYVGGDQYSQFFAGDVVNVQVFDRELSGAEIITLAASRTASISSGLIAHWGFNDKLAGESYDGFAFPDLSGGGITASGSDGANNTGLTAQNQ